MATSTQCAVELSPSVYGELQDFVERDGAVTPGAIRNFVEAAVTERIFREAARQAKDANAGRSESEIQAAVDEALAWARSRQ